MARNRQPILKRCRALGIEPIALGINKKSNRGMRPNANKKPTEYAIQLKEKQKVKFIYGVMEKQFRKLYKEATRRDGVAGENLLGYLERRLDNVVYRLGFTKTRNQARQVVSHSHILVNGKKVNIPSYRVKAGDVVTLAEASKQVEFIKEALEVAKTPSWLELNAEKMEGSVLQLPKRENVDVEINEQLIVEFYSR